MSLHCGRAATYFPAGTAAVSSARAGLTSLFGMGRGAPRRNSRHAFLFVRRHGCEGEITGRTPAARLPGAARPEASGQLVPLG